MQLMLHATELWDWSSQVRDCFRDFQDWIIHYRYPPLHMNAMTFSLSGVRYLTKLLRLSLNIECYSSPVARKAMNLDI